MNVFTIDRRDERLVQALGDFVSEKIALVLDFADFVRLVRDRRIGGEHFFEQPSSVPQLVGHSQEIGVELFLARNETEPCHDDLPLKKRRDSIRKLGSGLENQLNARYPHLAPSDS